MATATPKKTATAVSAAVTPTGLLEFTFAHGEKLTLNPEALSETIRRDALLHGLKAKLIDGAAIARNPDTGRSATIDDKFLAVKKIFDRITSPEGTWNENRKGNGGGNKSGGLFMAAMMRLTSKSREEVDAYLESIGKDAAAAMRKNPRVVEMMETIRAERANTEGIDSDALLDAFLDGGAGPNAEGNTDDSEGETGQ